MTSLTGLGPKGSLANVSVIPPPGPPIDIGGVGLLRGGSTGLPITGPSLTGKGCTLSNGGTGLPTSGG